MVKRWVAFLMTFLLYAAAVLAQDTNLVIRPIAEFPRQPIPFFEFHWAGDALYLSAKDALYRFRPADGEPPQPWRPFPNIWDFVYIAPDTNLIIAEELDSASGRLTIHRQTLDGKDGNNWREELLEISVGEGIMPWTAYTPDGRLVGLLLPDWTMSKIELQVYDLDLGALLWSAGIRSNEGFLNELTFTSDGRYLALSGETNSVLVWDTVRGKITTRFESPDEYDILRGVNFSPDGQWMYVVGFNKLFILKRDQNRWVRDAVYPAVVDFSNLALSADGRTMLGLSYQSAEIHIWDVAGSQLSLQEILTVEDGGWILGLPVVSEDGRYLAATDSDGIIRVWQR